MILDPKILADLAVAITPKSYVRVTPMARAATPLGAGFGITRFASPTKTFKVIYLGQDLTTGVAETLVRDRFQGKVRRKLLDAEAALWGATEACPVGGICVSRTVRDHTRHQPGALRAPRRADAEEYRPSDRGFHGAF